MALEFSKIIAFPTSVLLNAFQPKGETVSISRELWEWNPGAASPGSRNQGDTQGQTQVLWGLTPMLWGGVGGNELSATPCCSVRQRMLMISIRIE